MAISFNAIPANISTFGQFVELDNSRALRGLPGKPHRALILGHMLATGSASADVAIPVRDKDQADGLFGAGSMLSQAVAAFRRVNSFTELDVIAHAPLAGAPAAVSAIHQLTVASAATAAGTLAVYVAGKRYAVAVAAGDSAADIATKIAADVTARGADGPVTAAASSEIVSFTARHAGPLGNEIDIRVNHLPTDVLPAGVTVSIQLRQTSGADGTGTGGTASLTNAIAAMANVQYDTIVTCFNDATLLTTLEAELATRRGPMVQLAGQAFAALDDTLANLSTFGNGRNSEDMTILGTKGEPALPWEVAAEAAGRDAGEPDPARPRQTLPLTGIRGSKAADRFTRAERDVLLNDGISTLYVDDAGVVRIDRLITTYQTNAAGAADKSYRDITTMRTLEVLRYQARTRIATRYPRHKLAADGTRFAPGQNVITPSVMRSEMLALAREWERAGLVEGFDQFKRDLIVEINATDPSRLDVRMAPNLVNGMVVFALQIQFGL